MSAAAAQSSIAKELGRLSDRLTYMSESDYLVEPFFMEGEGRKSLKASDLLNPLEAGRSAASGWKLFARSARPRYEWCGVRPRRSGLVEVAGDAVHAPEQ